jgi:phosphate transport system substrate-binding protein
LLTGLGIFALGILNCGPKDTLVISGSETMYGMAEFIGKEYEKSVPGIRVQVFGGGSVEGIQRLIEGRTDIALSSRDLSPEELSQLNKMGDLEKLTIAYDGVAVVVHPSNPVTKLHLKQISEIFSGKITNWKQVGGSEAPIQLVVRNDKSGTLSYFIEHVVKQKDLGGKAFESAKDYNFSKDAKTVSNNLEMANLISENSNAIGFMGMGSAEVENDKKVKPISYAIRPEDPFVEPNIDNVYNRKYKLSRALYMIFKTETQDKIDAFASFITGEVGQNLILKRGYLRASLPEIEVKADPVSSEK